MLSLRFNQSYELCSPFALTIVMSYALPSFSHVVTVVSPFCSSVFHFLAKPFKICEIFFVCEKKTMKLNLLHKNVNTSSNKKGIDGTNRSYQFEL